MKTTIKEMNAIACAVVHSDQVMIHDSQSALDFMMTVQYETGCTRIVLNKEAISEDFFILSKGLAGEVLQKFINYKVKFAIIGDFSKYTSRPLRDFICESNNGKDIFFVSTEQEAIEKLTTYRLTY